MKAFGLAALAIVACSPDVIVGENVSGAEATRMGDSGLLAVRYDAASGVAVAAGHHGCAEPSSVDCDVWLAEVDEQAAVTSVDLFASGLLDTAHALWLLGPEDRILAGVASSSGSPRALALRFQAEALLWSTEDISLAPESAAHALELASDGTLVSAGSELRDDGELDGFVARIDTDGNVLARTSLEGSLADGTEIASAVIAVGSRIFVAGVRRSGGQRLPAVVALTSDLAVFGSNTGLGLALGDGKIASVLSLNETELVLCGSGEGQAFVGRINYALTEFDSMLLGTAAGDIDVHACALTDDGGVVLVGAAGGAPWVSKVDSLTLEETFTLTPEPATASLWAVAGTTDGRALAVGRNEPTGRPFAIDVGP